jgi:hypothetical protein
LEEGGGEKKLLINAYLWNYRLMFNPIQIKQIEDNSAA